MPIPGTFAAEGHVPFRRAFLRARGARLAVAAGKGSGARPGVPTRAPLVMEARIASPFHPDESPWGWRGPQAEAEADRLLRRLCLDHPSGAPFTWDVQVRLSFDDGTFEDFPMAVSRGCGNRGARRAAVERHAAVALDLSRPLQERLEARGQAERLAGVPLPALRSLDEPEPEWLRGLRQRLGKRTHQRSSDSP